MTWSRFDDGYDEHDKIEEAWDADHATIGLHVQATTACNRWSSDGVIKPRWLRGKLTDKERTQVLALMVEHDLFDALAAGEQRTLIDSDGNQIVVGPFSEDRYVVHDFLDRHDSSVQVKARRAADAARKRQSRRQDAPTPSARVRAASERTPAGTNQESDGTPGARTTAAAPLDGYAGPPAKPASSRKREQERYSAELEAYAAWLLPDLDEPERTQHVRAAVHGALPAPVTNERVAAWARQWCSDAGSEAA